MSTPNFDERYPAMFQPGGDGTDTPSPTPTPPTAANTAANANTTASPAHLNPAEVPEPEPVPNSGSGPEEEQDSQTSLDPGASWQPQLWITALAASAVLLAAGLFALTAQFWLPAAQTINPADFQGIDLPPWGQMLFSAAPPLIGVGIGIPAVLLLLATRHDHIRESVRRTLFLVLAAVLGVAGWIALFANELFPAVTATWQNDYARRPALPWTYAVGETGIWLFSLSLLMLSALLVVPRRWPRRLREVPGGKPADETDDGATALPATLADTPQSSRPGPAMRGLLFGAVSMAGALFALFAPYLYPGSTGIVIVELAGGHQTTIQDWASTSYKLVTPLMAAGTLVIGATLLNLATAPAVGRAPQQPNDVEL